jgi:hypothetical protein
VAARHVGIEHDLEASGARLAAEVQFHTTL